MWVYAPDGFVQGLNPNDMEGNSGWVEVSGAVPEPLSDEEGTPLYRVEDGEIVRRDDVDQV